MSLVVKGNLLFLDGRCVGEIVQLANGKRVFKSIRNRSEHYFRRFQGWGLSREILQYLQLQGITEIHLQVSPIETLESTVKDWLTHAIPYHHPPFEPQLILPEIYMKRHKLTLSQITL